MRKNHNKENAKRIKHILCLMVLAAASYVLREKNPSVTPVADTTLAASVLVIMERLVP